MDGEQALYAGGKCEVCGKTKRTGQRHSCKVNRFVGLVASMRAAGEASHTVQEAAKVIEQTHRLNATMGEPMRWSKHSEAAKRRWWKRKREQLRELLWEKSKQEGECWTWIGRTWHGVPILTLGGECLAVWKFVALRDRPMPLKLTRPFWVCDNEKCVCPEHMQFRGEVSDKVGGTPFGLTDSQDGL